MCFSEIHDYLKVTYSQQHPELSSVTKGRYEYIDFESDLEIFLEKKAGFLGLFRDVY